MSLTELFCDVDAFCQEFLAAWQDTLLGGGQRQKRFRLAPSEVMTIVIDFHRSRYRHFKHDDQKHVCIKRQDAFPERVSYQRFVERMASVLTVISLVAIR